jgi:hypothetical protein
MNIHDGTRVYSYDHMLTDDTELYAFEGGLLVLYSPGKDKHVGIDPTGMTLGELDRAITAGDTLLARTERAPVNRHARRAADRLN